MPDTSEEEHWQKDESNLLQLNIIASEKELPHHTFQLETIYPIKSSVS